MRGTTLRRSTAQPATRLIAVAGLVLALVIAQFVLLLAGGVAADRAARHAAEESVEYLTEVARERVLNSVRAVDHLVRDTTRTLRRTQPEMQELVTELSAALEHSTEADALSVTYPNGDFVEVRRSEAQIGGYRAYVAGFGDGTVGTRLELEYDANLTEVSRRSSNLAFGTTETPSYLGALDSFEVVWTGPSYDPVSEQDVVRASLLARDRLSESVLVVAANLAIVPLQQSLSTLPAGSDGRILVLASDGNAIAAATTSAHDDVAAPGGHITTVRRVLDSSSLDWVLQVRASAGGHDGGFARLKSTLDLVMGGLLILTVVLGYALASMWRPIMRMRYGAERDALTGLYNRRHVDAAAESLLRFADRTESRVAFVMFDLDDFKSLNDDLGHSAGDQALAAIGARVAKETRAGDLVARWGGDEFLLVLLLRPDDDAAEVVERVRAGAQSALNDMFPDRLGLGATAGYALTDVVGDDVGVLIASADRALVHGKALAKGQTYAFIPRWQRTSEGAARHPW